MIGLYCNSLLHVLCSYICLLPSQEFPEFGTFEGRITEWDGKHYHVYYSEDEDQEELNESDFEDLEVLSIPEEDGGKAALAGLKKRRKKKKRRKARAED